jgi:hypothetical protein
MSEEWGPWIEHDGKGCPVPGRAFVDVIYRDGRSHAGRMNQAVVSAPNWIWPKQNGLEFASDVIRYRIRKPRALQDLIAIAADPYSVPPSREVVPA